VEPGAPGGSGGRHDGYDRLWGSTPEELADSGTRNFQNNPEMVYLTDEYEKQRTLLLQTQKAAGTSMGFNERFGKVPRDSDGNPYRPSSYAFHPDGTLFLRTTGDDLRTWFEGDEHGGREGERVGGIDQGLGWTLYQDNTWAFGDLDTAEQLKDMLAKIEAAGDPEHLGTSHYRNADQRSYLAQKAYTRYLGSKINDLGGYDYMWGWGDKGQMIWDSYTNRNQDEDRPMGSGRAGMFGLDPLYSELDDKDLLVSDHFIKNIVHRPGYEQPHYADMKDRYGQDRDPLLNLKLSGMIDMSDPEKNPDYVAGRFENINAYQVAAEIAETAIWDESSSDYVRYGLQTDEREVYDDETKTYKMPLGWIKPGSEAALESRKAAQLQADRDAKAAAAAEAASKLTTSEIYAGLTQEGGNADWMGGDTVSGISVYDAGPGDYPPGWGYDPREHQVTAPDGRSFSYPDESGQMWDHFDELEVVAKQAEIDKRFQEGLASKAGQASIRRGKSRGRGA